ncbi:aldose 1-epimerase [Mesorhizobium sp. VK25A]|uniref:Aldose 1-epimerase n=1 Tax=Mesorhizobium vachelliae TaxID=3072309 RepID=A0ABU5AAT1_9HYPH|nr:MULTISPECIES: aldose 1-epimerase [unclassified Mesorhizobium]MDX8534829.1 aldose 1-epimerase [Mesorhizobium sp. VK25D]MDX8547288.1 aldose 1-epimerase [Mesorhizobium sp. VK25A]
MVGAIELNDGQSRLALAPEKGAAIARYDALVVGTAPVPLLKPGDGTGASGCQLLVPWSNRISGGGFTFDGRFHAVQPNVPDEAFPIHGDGFQKPWRLVRQTDIDAELVLDDGAIGPYRYSASATYALRDGALNVRLTVENRAGMRLPYGLGFHPWFPRGEKTALQAKAKRVWLEDERHLPTGVVPVSEHPGWDFSRPVPLPQGWVNNAFDGWDGRALIVQPEEGIKVTLNASPELDVYILYSSSSDAGFFCFEPVSHPVDAHHGEGLTALDHGQTMSATMRLEWEIAQTD